MWCYVCGAMYQGAQYKTIIFFILYLSFEIYNGYVCIEIFLANVYFIQRIQQSILKLKILNFQPMYQIISDKTKTNKHESRKVRLINSELVDESGEHACVTLLD